MAMKNKCECQLCIAGLTDHERRITKLENKKKSKMPAWFQEWNEHDFTPLVKKANHLEEDVKYLKANAVMKDDLDEILDKKLRKILKPSAFKDSK